MRTVRLTKICAALTVGLGAVALSGCSTLEEITGGAESVDYKSTVRGEPLSVPPDLTQAQADAHYRAPEGTSFSSYMQSREAQQQAVASGSNILPQTDGIEVKRDGQLRWLVVDMPAEKIFPEVIEFWGTQGFTIRSQDPRAGVIQTDWAENRSKIPEGWIRSALGAIVDQIFDSGERERFTTRMERVNGKTEIYISHQHMEETPTPDGSTFKWVFGKEDPNLNAAMLARLMVYLGTDQERAQSKVAQAEQSERGTAVETVTTANEAFLRLNEPFDRAWRRVGVAIDSAGFSLEDRDRSSGEYFIRYLDSDTGEKIEQANIFTRMFGGRNTAEAQVYRIRVMAEGSGSVVTVLNNEGQMLSTETARRIITVLSNHIGK